MKTIDSLLRILLDAKSGAESKKEAAYALRLQFRGAQSLPLATFMGFLGQLSQVGQISFFSDLLDIYAPSYGHVPLEKRDSGWAFYDVLGAAERHADFVFFEGLAQSYAAISATSPIGEVLAFSRIKHSGWFSEQGFFVNLQIFEKKYGAVPLELVLDYRDEAALCFPDLCVIRWFMACYVLAGEALTSQWLFKACRRQPQDTFFDLENFWIHHHEALRDWFQTPFGRIVAESRCCFADLGLK